jgi:hypothetical protein
MFSGFPSFFTHSVLGSFKFASNSLALQSMGGIGSKSKKNEKMSSTPKAGAAGKHSPLRGF